MHRILFICHGNICRSPMAEYIMKELVREAGLSDEFEIASAATHTDALGNPVYPPARAALRAHGVPCPPRAARQLCAADRSRYDLLVGMDCQNIADIRRICGEKAEEKIYLLMDFTDRAGDIPDPWFTRDFEAAWHDIDKGCRGLLERLR